MKWCSVHDYGQNTLLKAASTSAISTLNCHKENMLPSYWHVTNNANDDNTKESLEILCTVNTVFSRAIIEKPLLTPMYYPNDPCQYCTEYNLSCR